ncbi:cupredoxin family copper-binding protein [Altererythrobacter arenosus]|uniref:Cupredoxin family copper-binding protein n=1 Tax=Altererythrobacter arenosus TaxID=3032592 RepID=A0ABY8FRV0_9SPHN|nr:cupredoxin family copper-binding protein [Altererythrobacter sp. CAU 1644]WFL77730.1 cupredoxin family copper-binding protein [Altererythrobacter sp. CAU 1644]
MKASVFSRKSGGRVGASLATPTLLIATLAVLAVGAVFASADSASAKGNEGSRTHVVEIRQFKFFPATLEVKTGDTITWKNLDAAPHTATARGKPGSVAAWKNLAAAPLAAIGQAWDSGKLNRNQSWSLKITGKGTVEYICAYHPGMKGKIVVK